MQQKYFRTLYCKIISNIIKNFDKIFYNHHIMHFKTTYKLEKTTKKKWKILMENYNKKLL